MALDGSASVRRVDLPSRTAGLKFSLGSSSLDGPYRANDLAVVPGAPGSVAVIKSANNGGFTRLHSVYDEGVERAKVFASNNGSTAVEFAGSASTLYSIDKGDLSDPRFRRLSVAADGLTQTSSTGNLVNGATDIKFDAGLLYASNGKVINPASASVVGDFGNQNVGTSGALVVPDSASNHVLFLTGNIFGGQTPRTLTLRAYDQTTLQPTGTLDIPGVTGIASSLLRWGANGIAFRTSGGEVYLVRSDLVPSTADVTSPAPTWTPRPTPTPVPATVRSPTPRPT